MAAVATGENVGPPIVRQTMYVGEWKPGADKYAWWRVPHTLAGETGLDFQVVFLGESSDEVRERALKAIRAGAEIASSVRFPPWFVPDRPKNVVVADTPHQRFMPNDSALYLEPRMLARDGKRYVALCLVFAEAYLYLSDCRWASLSNATIRKACYQVQESLVQRAEWDPKWLDWVRRERWTYLTLNRERRPDVRGRIAWGLRGVKQRLAEYVVLAPVVYLHLSAPRRRRRTQHDGIRLLDAREGGGAGDFQQAVVDALELLRRHDDRRYKRIRREISTIACSDSSRRAGVYVRPGRVCFINYAKFLEVERIHGRSEALKQLASLVVHESTHGRLDRFPFAGYYEARVEALCSVEAFRFLRGLPDDVARFAARRVGRAGRGSEPGGGATCRAT